MTTGKALVTGESFGQQPLNQILSGLSDVYPETIHDLT